MIPWVISPTSFKVIGGLLGALALLWGVHTYIDGKVSQKLSEARYEALEDAVKRIEELKPILDTIVANQQKFEQEEVKQTNEIIQKFNKTNGANDSSGIHGDFVR